MTINTPRKYQYDYGLGIEPDIIDYMKESIEIASRISPMKCYLMVQTPTGSVVGSSSSYITVSSYVDTSPNYRASVWPSGSFGHPDIRPYTNSGSGSIYVNIDGTPAQRVIDAEDLIADNEFAVIKRFDLDPARVELVFNEDFVAADHTIEYYYTTLQSGINEERIKTGEDSSETFYGWTQYINNSCDDFRDYHQILVRFPMTTEDILINEEGRIKLEEVNSWMIWEPKVNDFDLLIITSDQSFSGDEERYEVVDKKNSYIQGNLITQRFKLRFLEPSDPRYQIPYETTV